jgi:Domain of unknown function (DUF1772)
LSEVNKRLLQMLSVTSSALFLNGVCLGSFGFVSAVDARLLRALANKQDADTLKAVFPLWWPFGRDWMAPLVTGTTIANGLALYAARRNAGASTQVSQAWAGATALVLVTLPWTMLVMGESIVKLRSASVQDVCSLTKKFCNLHHARTAAATAAFVLALWAQAKTHTIAVPAQPTVRRN